MARLAILALAWLALPFAACASRPNIDYEGLRDIGYDFRPAPGSAPVPMERAVALVAADNPSLAVKAEAISAAHLLLTTSAYVCRDGERAVRCRDRLVWLVTMTGTEIAPHTCGARPLAGTPVGPQGCPANREWNVLVDAATGERMFEFTYR